LFSTQNKKSIAFKLIGGSKCNFGKKQKMEENMNLLKKIFLLTLLILTSPTAPQASAQQANECLEYVQEFCKGGAGSP
jgi:hypothetical protein